MTTAQKTELQKLDSGFLKDILSRSVITVAAAAVLVNGAQAVVDHVKTERAETRAVQVAQLMVPQGIFDITNLSEKAPADLRVLKDAIQVKRDAMDQAATEVGLVGQMLGMQESIEARSGAYSALMQTVQDKIDTIEKDGWQPTEHVKNRTAFEKKLDDIFVENAQSMYVKLNHYEPVQVRSR